MSYRTLNHSKFLLHYHIIFVVKYRKPLLTTYGGEMKQILQDIADKSDFTIEEMEVDQDHVHLLVNSVPKLSPLQLVRQLKQISTRNIWKLFPDELAKEFSREKTFWTDGYFAASVGQIDNLFNLGRHLLRAKNYRAFRERALNEWTVISWA